MTYRDELRFVLCAMAFLAFASPAAIGRADEDEQKDENAASAESETEARDSETPDEPDPLAIPEGDAAEMLQFIRTLSATPPQGETEAEKLRYRGLVSRAMADAADQGLAADPDAREAQLLVSMKFMALQTLQTMVTKELEMASQEARESDNPVIASAGWRQLVSGAVSTWAKKSDREKQAFRDALLDEFPEEPAAASARASAIRMAAMYLERTDSAYAEKLVEDSIAELKKSDDEDVRKIADKLAGMIRRMRLMGNEMEITGPLLNGDEVDWPSYRGKVVLVDFWATWCGPCRAEVPNVKEVYAGYHEKGFDVLGISLDTSREKTEEYLEKEEIPWPTLFGATEAEQGWDHPMALYYGISGIPTAILVDADGTVVHMNARGNALKEEVQKLLGDPVEVEKPAEEAEEEAGDEAGGK